MHAILLCIVQDRVVFAQHIYNNGYGSCQIHRRWKRVVDLEIDLAHNIYRGVPGELRVSGAVGCFGEQ